jgi:hypothetical protein
LVSWKGAVALGAILVALAVYLLLTRPPAAPARTSAGLVPCPAAEVVDLSVTGTSGTTEARRDSATAGWILVRPSSGPADSATLDDLASSLSGLSASATLKSPPAASELGLAPPAMTVTCEVRSGASYTLTIGGENFDGSGRYARKGGGGPVYVIASATVAKFQKALDQPPVAPSPSPSGSPSPSPSA